LIAPESSTLADRTLEPPTMQKRRRLSQAAAPVTSAAGVVIVSFFVACAGPAAADNTPYFVGVSQAVVYESNSLRLESGQALPDGLKFADSLFVTSLLGGFDQPYGRQRGYGNLSLRQNSYASNSGRNNQAYTGLLGLDWSTIERISGSLSISANRSLSNADGLGLSVLQEKNFETNQSLNTSIAMGLVTEYSLEAGFSHLEVRNSLTNRTLLARDFDRDNASVGVRWRPSPAASLGLNLRESRGRYPRFRQVADGSFLSDRFKQQGVEISAALQPSGASSFDLRMGQNKTRYDLNQARDFSGLTGSLGWNWQATGKLRLSTRLSRDTGQNSIAQTLFGVPGRADYTQLLNTFRMQADFDVTAKIAFSSSWQTVQRKSSQLASGTNDPRDVDKSGKDLTHLFTLGARWLPYRTTTISCDGSIERRSAQGELAAALRNSTFGCSGQFQLQL
jgi:hypothetical protein